MEKVFEIWEMGDLTLTPAEPASVRRLYSNLGAQLGSITIAGGASLRYIGLSEYKRRF